MKPILKSSSVAFLLAFLVLLAGHGSLSQAAEFQKGSYSGTRPNGDKIVLKFEDGGKFSLVDKDGKVLVVGAYKVTKSRIELTDESGPMAAKDAKPGKYDWKLESDKLTFSKFDDESEGRSKGLTRSPWTLEK